MTNWIFGFSRRELVPDDILTGGYYMSGYSSNKKITGVYEPTCARCAYFELGTEKLLLISLDLTGLSHADSSALRASVACVCGLPAERVNVMCTHSHAAIDTLGLWGDLKNGISGRRQSYIDLVTARCCEASLEAVNAAEPGELYVGRSGELRCAVLDIRKPYVSDPVITRLRFRPQSGAKETVIIHFNCHPESLTDTNTLLSPDWPGETLRLVESELGCEAMYINGCVGGMQTSLLFYGEDGRRLPPREEMLRYGRMIGRRALELSDSPAAPELSFRRAEVLLPLYNPNFAMAARAGFLNEHLIPGESPTGLLKRTEVSLLRLGGITAALLPGELFPELLTGGYLTDGDCAVPGTPTEPTIRSILGKDTIVFGLANDEIGYILPANDFLLDSEHPFEERAFDRFGRRHYEETNSTGPETAAILINKLRELL